MAGSSTALPECQPVVSVVAVLLCFCFTEEKVRPWVAPIRL